MTEQITHNIEIEVQVEKSFSYADYHTDCIMRVKDDENYTEYSFIKNITIKNNSAIAYKDLKLVTAFSHSAFNMQEILIKTLDEYEVISHWLLIEVLNTSTSSPLSSK